MPFGGWYEEYRRSYEQGTNQLCVHGDTHR